MKPRQRKPQKQTSRLYARGNDHRDILYYDETTQKYIYHNALYYTEVDQDKPVRENIAWVKYPEHNLAMTYGGASNQAGAVCMMDVDRQFQHGRSWAGGQRGRGLVYGLECGIAVAFTQYGGSTTNFSISEDGVIWQDLDVSGANPSQMPLYHFGEDGLCWIVQGATIYGEDYPYRAGFTIGTIIFKKDEETKKWYTELHQYSYADRNNDCQFVCNTKQGFILYTTYGAPFDQSGTAGVNNPTYWHIDHAGVKTEKKYELWNNSYLWEGMKSWAYAKVGNRCFCIVAYEQSISRWSTQRYYRIAVISSSDQGATWTGKTLEEYHWSQEGWVDPASMRVSMYVRDGEIFACYSMDKILSWKFKMVSTYTGTQWDEISLPSWIDLPVIEGGGACVNPSPSKESLRIAVDPLNASDYDVTMASMIVDASFDSNLRSGSIMFKDGEMVKQTDDVFWLYFGNPNIDGWCVFFDNRHLAASSRAFAWQVAYYNNTNNIPDTVQPNDYCVRGE